MKQRQTKKQALSTCNDYQDIVGKLYLTVGNTMEVVAAVCIAPHDKKNKATFIDRYKIYRDVEKAISFYQGLDYDIVVFTNCPDGLCCRDLAEFTDGDGMLQHG